MFTCCPPGLFAQCHTPVTVSRYMEDTALKRVEFHLLISLPCGSLSRSRGRAATSVLLNIIIVIIKLTIKSKKQIKLISVCSWICSYWSEQHALLFNYPRHLEVCWIQMWDNECGYFLCRLQLYESTEDKI